MGKVTKKWFQDNFPELEFSPEGYMKFVKSTVDMIMEDKGFVEVDGRGIPDFFNRLVSCTYMNKKNLKDKWGVADTWMNDYYQFCYRGGEDKDVNPYFSANYYYKFHKYLEGTYPYLCFLGGKKFGYYQQKYYYKSEKGLVKGLIKVYGTDRTKFNKDIKILNY